MGSLMQTTNKSKRIDITLPEQTIDQIDNIWREFGFASRSSFIDEAAKRLAIRLKKADIKQRLRVGYKVRANRDSDINKELDILSFDSY